MTAVTRGARCGALQRAAQRGLCTLQCTGARRTSPDLTSDEFGGLGGQLILYSSQSLISLLHSVMLAVRSMYLCILLLAESDSPSRTEMKRIAYDTARAGLCTVSYVIFELQPASILF